MTSLDPWSLGLGAAFGGGGGGKKPYYDLPDSEGGSVVMGPNYGRPGHQWAGGSDEIQRLYEREHSFDMSSGDIKGPLGPVPWQLAIKYQSIHNQLVWRARNRMAQDAVRMMQGAAGTMSTFRAGGGAALESGVFAQTAGLQMQRASMQQPMDLMADYRREQDHKARSGGGNKWASYGGAILSAVGTGVSAAGYPYIGIPLSAAGGALQGYGAGSGGGYYPQQGGYGAGGGMFGGGQPGQQGGPMVPGGGEQQGGSITQPGTQPRRPGTTPAGQQPGGAPAPSGITPPGTQSSTLQGGQGGAAPGMASGGEGGAGEDQPGGPGAGQGGPGGPGGQGMGYVPTGAGDGGMLPVQRLARRLAQTPYPMEFDMVMSEILVQELESDPTFSFMTATIDREVMMRFASGSEVAA